MKIENEIFKRMHVNFDKLIDYGFMRESDNYKYSKIFMNGNFKADIMITKNGILSGRVYDLQIDDEYTNIRIENNVGEFINSVKEEYQNILIDIRNHCFEKEYFIHDQANRIARLIIDRYQDIPEFLWVKFPGYGVFRNSNNNKWYSIIMNINKSKIDKNHFKEIEIINVKLEEEKIKKLLTRKGFYPSYHMNKKNWITIILDDTLSDEEIMDYVKESHSYTEISKEWLVPANPKFYDVIHCFDETDTITWKQSTNIVEGDIIYLYVGKPYSAILYQCEVIEAHIPYFYQDQNLSIKEVMKIKLLKRYHPQEFTLERLGHYGINTIRGPRSITKKLSQELTRAKEDNYEE